jgi:hypothetical protein
VIFGGAGGEAGDGGPLERFAATRVASLAEQDLDSEGREGSEGLDMLGDHPGFPCGGPRKHGAGEVDGLAGAGQEADGPQVEIAGLGVGIGAEAPEIENANLRVEGHAHATFGRLDLVQLRARQRAAGEGGLDVDENGDPRGQRGQPVAKVRHRPSFSKKHAAR